MKCPNPEPHEPHWHTVFLDAEKRHAAAGGWCSGEGDTDEHDQQQGD